MFQLSREKQMRFDAAHVLYFPGEDVDPDVLTEWTADLDEYIDYIPEQFHAAIADRTLARDEVLYKAFSAWCAEVLAEQFVEREVDEKALLADLHESAQVIFEGTLHDAVIKKVRREGQDITFYLDGTAGFNAYSFVELTFENVRSETGTFGYYYIYDELVKTANGYAYRLLSDNPYKEWTIEFDDARAKYVYNPAIKDKFDQYASIEDYVDALNSEFRYAVKIDNELTDIELSDLVCTDAGCFLGEILIGQTVEDVADAIYTYEYENPHAYFSEPVALEDLYTYAMSDDLELRVRAYNTLYALDGEAAEMANAILRDSVLTEDNEMILSVIAGHFHSMNLLDEENVRKYDV